MRIISKDGLVDVGYEQSIVFYEDNALNVIERNGEVFEICECDREEAKKILTHIRHCYIEGRSYCHINDYYEKKEKKERETE